MTITSETEQRLRLWQVHMAAGRMAAEIGSYQQARRKFQTALTMAEENNFDPPLIARSLSGLARAFGGINDNREAEELLRRAVAIDQTLPEDAIALYSDNLQLIALFRETGRSAEAVQLATEVLAKLEKLSEVPAELRVGLMRQLASSHCHIFQCELAIGYLESDKLDLCQTQLEAALAIACSDTSMGRHCLAYGQLLAVKVLCLIDQDRPEEAEMLYHQCIQILEMQRGPSHPRTAELMTVFAKHCSKVGKPDLVRLFDQHSSHT